ncbi:hypothetical protein AeMF1_012910 [Aphanomyces euteiches]|nr:hypothetical protein AeMF1_012910 [Aphanomyces euteiches]KAH9191200.1 hypothetical protein AeNC1_006820 [Aphanomyces euteiches]
MEPPNVALDDDEEDDVAMNDTLHLFPESSSEEALVTSLQDDTVSPEAALDAFDMPTFKSHMPRTGRPCHPVWNYFVRGEKQNRFHYRAYCRFCMDAHNKSTTAGVDDESSKIRATRGVSADMIKHLEQCTLCPPYVVDELLKKQLSLQSKRRASSLHSNVVPVTEEEDETNSSRLKRVQVWQATLSAQLDMSWTQDPRLHAWLKLPPLTTDDMLTTARELARSQLDKVKEGMLNSTIKSGLTLSINSWKTRRHQHLVAFSLMNSDGDAHALSVVESEWTCDALETHVRAILRSLHDDLKVSIVSIVADSMLAWTAASRVQATAFPDLLVLPCITEILSTLIGVIMTSEEQFIGILIEFLAWCRHPKIVEVVVVASAELFGGDSSSAVFSALPNRRQATSYVESIRHALVLEHCFDHIESHLPSSLVESLSPSFWNSLRQLNALLDPIADVFTLLQHPMAATSSSKMLSHVLYTFGRLHQAYTTRADLVELPTAKTVVALIDRMWNLYETPAMVLAFRFDFHLEPTWLASTVMSAVPASFATYSTRWFHTTPPITRIQDILVAVETNAFPFDCTRDYHDVSSFYSGVANSYPELCALCCRLYAMSIFAAPVRQVLRGIGYVASHARTTHDATTVLPLLHIGFTTKISSSTAKIHAKDPNADRWLHAHENQVEMICSKSEWKLVATQWKSHIQAEIAAMPPLEGTSGSENTTLQHLFATTLPPPVEIHI